MKVLVAGGAGYIGSTVASALLDAGHSVVVVDNLSTGCPAFVHDRAFYRADIEDLEPLRTIFVDHPDIDVTIHCAALIQVEESILDPLRYYDENVAKSIRFIRHLVALGGRRLMFSSSAAIYERSDTFEVTESTPAAPASPYGRTKAIFETVLRDCAAAYGMAIACLRYFNPIGADPSLRSGDARLEPSHVLGRIAHADQVGLPFTVHGVDWPTRDGTPLRDFIHVWDLATAHVRIVEGFDDIIARGTWSALNVGSGAGTTVAELVAAYDMGQRRKTVIEVGARRAGDTAGAYANVDLMRRLLNWQPELTVHDAIAHAAAWRHQMRRNQADHQPV